MNRNRYISHFSAATFWDIPYLDVVLGSSANLCEAFDYTYYRSSNRYFAKGERVHLCRTPLPARAVKCVNGKYVASPELVFVQLAGKIDFHRLILLGLQLCSHPPGKPELSVTTKNKLKNFVDKSSGLEGHRKAAQAIKYLENGSASIMESLAFMVLTLPHFLGGYGLKGALFNYEIKLKNETDKKLGEQRCFADLYYKSARLAVEYDSHAFHSSPYEQGKDALRAALMERNGIETRSLSTIQLYDKHACKNFAFNLARHLDKRIRIRAKDFELMHAELRKLFPYGGTLK